MMVVARITKRESPFWSVECDTIGAYTFGESLEDAISVLEGWLRVTLHDIEGHHDFEARVIGVRLDPEDNSYDAYIETTPPSLLAALVLKHQRGLNQLSLSDVAERLGVSSRSSYANYEQGRADPSMAKFRELLGVVAPDYAVMIVPRPPPVSAIKPAASRTRRKTSHRARASRRSSYKRRASPPRPAR